MNPKNRGALLMLTCAFLWSTAGVVIKYIPWNPVAIAGVRAMIAAVTVLVWLRVSKTPLRITANTWKVAVVMGATCLLFVIANKMTTAANAIVLQFTAPVFLLLFSAVFLGKRFCRADVLTVVLTLGGIALFFFDQLDGGRMLGNIVAVISGCTMGLMYMFMDDAKPAERLSSVFLSNALVALVGVPFAFITKVEVSTVPVLLILFLGVLQLGIPYILYALAAGDCPPLTCCLLSAIEPLLNPLWVLLFYGEKPGVFALIGGAIVIVTITAWSIYGEKRTLKETP